MTGIGTTEGTRETRTTTSNSSAKVAFILNKSQLSKFTLESFAYKRDPHKRKIWTKAALDECNIVMMDGDPTTDKF